MFIYDRNISSTRCLFMGKNRRSISCLFMGKNIRSTIGVYLWITLYFRILIFYTIIRNVKDIKYIYIYILSCLSTF